MLVFVQCRPYRPELIEPTRVNRHPIFVGRVHVSCATVGPHGDPERTLANSLPFLLLLHHLHASDGSHFPIVHHLQRYWVALGVSELLREVFEEWHADALEVLS